MMVGAVVVVGRGTGFGELLGVVCSAMIGAGREAAGVALLVTVIGATVGAVIGVVAVLVAVIGAIVGAVIGAVMVATVGALMGAGIGTVGWCGSTEVLSIFSKLQIAVLSSVPVSDSGNVGCFF